MSRFELFEPLEKWPDGVADFPETLQGKIHYDPELKRLVLFGPLADDDLKLLLTMTGEQVFVNAVKRLHARSKSLLGSLQIREEDDSDYVTEQLDGMKKWIHRSLASWFVFLGAASIWTLICFWAAGNAAIQLSDEQRYMIIVLCAGVLGRSIVGLSSLVWFRAHRRLFRSWALWYFAQPFVAGMLAEVFYIVVRAGFFKTDNSTESVNIYGIAAISALVGMFTNEAMNKLSELFKTLFSSKTETAEGKAVPESATEKEEGQPRAE